MFLFCFYLLLFWLSSVFILFIFRLSSVFILVIFQSSVFILLIFRLSSASFKCITNSWLKLSYGNGWHNYARILALVYSLDSSGVNCLDQGTLLSKQIPFLPSPMLLYSPKNTVFLASTLFQSLHPSSLI